LLCFGGGGGRVEQVRYLHELREFTVVCGGNGGL